MSSSQPSGSAAGDACQSYVIYEAVETPNTFIFVEEWASLDGLYAHFHTPHFTEFFGALGELIAAPPVGTVSEVSSTRTLNDAFAAHVGSSRARQSGSGVRLRF
jgi:quinol monooxygenase YgiN